jgi:hypothetical protein
MSTAKGRAPPLLSWCGIGGRLKNPKQTKRRKKRKKEGTRGRKKNSLPSHSCTKGRHILTFKKPAAITSLLLEN